MITPMPVMRFTSIIALLLFVVMSVTPAEAQRSDPLQQCSERQMLAFLIQTESFSQPWTSRMRVGQIIRNDAAGRGVSICWLAVNTNFVAPFKYAQTHPTSWTAKQWSEIQPWGWEMADDILNFITPDLTEGMGHFNGVNGVIVFRP